MKLFVVGCGCAFALSGCLSNNYELSHEELVRLARTPPAQRGEHVRVVEQVGSGTDDVGWVDDEGSSYSPLAFSGNVSAGGGPPPRAPSGAAHTPWSAHANAGHVPPHGGLIRGSATPHGGSGGGSGGNGFSLGGGGGGGNDAIVEAIVAIVIANGIGIALAATEGARFDGWARVEPEAGIFLISPGRNLWLPLSELTEQDAAGANHGVVVDYDGNVERLSRAPLDRKGGAYEVELGTGWLNTVDRTGQLGFAARTGVGYFPTPRLGFLIADQVAFGYAGARLDHGAIFNGRLGVEVEYLPVQANRFHMGFYGELGGALVLQDLPDKTHSWSGFYTAGGVLAQIDWTTRLALNLRAGIASLPAHPGRSLSERSYVPELTIGIAVY